MISVRPTDQHIQPEKHSMEKREKMRKKRKINFPNIDRRQFTFIGHMIQIQRAIDESQHEKRIEKKSGFFESFCTTYTHTHTKLKSKPLLMAAFDIIAFDRPLHRTLFSILFDVIETDFRRFCQIKIVPRQIGFTSITKTQTEKKFQMKLIVIFDSIENNIQQITLNIHFYYYVE